MPSQFAIQLREQFHRIEDHAVDFADVPAGTEASTADLADLPLPDNSVDRVISPSVFERLTNPDAVYEKISRVQCTGESFIFLTSNIRDYGTQVARVVPNRWQAHVVKTVQG